MNEPSAQSREGALKEPRSGLATMGLVAGVLGATAIVFGFGLYAIDPSIIGLTVANVAFGVVALFFYGITNWRLLLRAFGGRSTAFVILEGAIAIGLLGALAAANYFAAESKVEWDFTRDRLFTLQPQSIKVAEGLKQGVAVIGFIRPSEAAHNQLIELVELYQRHTSRIRLEFINPDTAPPAIIREYQMTAASPRIVIAGDNKQTTKIKQATEEALTNALVKVADKPLRKVYFLTGHGEPSIEDDKSEGGYRRAALALHDDGYETEPLSLARSLIDRESVPKDATVIVVPATEKALFPNEAEALKAWLDRGGRMLVLLEPGVEPHLERIFEAYGIDVGDNLVIEPNAASRAFGFGPDAPVVQKFEAHPITDAMRGQAALFYQARSVAPHVGEKKARTTTLIQTGPSSWGETKFKAGGQMGLDDDDVPGPVPIAVASTADTLSATDRTSDQARLAVFGDASFANNRFFPMGGNGDLFQNAINWLAGDEDRISIRPKTRGSSRIPLTEREQYAIMFFSVNLLPLLIIGFGFSVWAVRRRK